MPRTKRPSTEPFVDEADLLAPERVIYTPHDYASPAPNLFSDALYKANHLLGVARSMKEFADTTYIQSETRHRLSAVYTKLCNRACDELENYL